MNGETISDSELIGAYASQGLLVGDPNGDTNPTGAFMQQHVRGLRALAEFALGKAGTAKPVAVVATSLPNSHAQTARLEEAGYVVVIATNPHVDVVIHGAPAPEVEEPNRISRYREGGTIRGAELGPLPSTQLPKLKSGLRWKQTAGRDEWTVVKDLAPIGG